MAQRSGKAVAPAEKSNFAQTCNLLSQYLKERGSFGNISHGITSMTEANKGPETSRTPATTLNLLPSMENPSKLNSVPSTNIKSMELFPPFLDVASRNPVEDSTNKNSDLRKSSTLDPGNAQMTIFYAGQVLVFDDFPAEKAKEIMALATKGTSNATNGFTTTASAMEKANNSTTTAPSSSNKVLDQGLQLRPQADGSDLPIARRASLHRFFEKRKDRAASKAPYQINNPTSPRRHEERNPIFIDLECQSPKQLDLNL